MLGRYVYVNGSTPKVPLSNNMNFAATPLVLTPFVPLRQPFVSLVLDSAANSDGRRHGWSLAADIWRMSWLRK